MRYTLLERPVPRGALVGAAAAVALSLAAAGTARLTGIGASAPPVAEAVESRDLRFEDRPDGAVAVLAEPGGRVIEVMAPGTNGFARGVLRSLVRERKREGLGPAAAPFRLTLWDDGRMTLEDPATGQRIGLEAFGPTNFGAFARLLAAGGAAS